MEIYDLRKELNMTQKAFASELGIPVGTIRNWEQGLSKPPSYVLSLIEERFAPKEPSGFVGKDEFFELMNAMHAVEVMALASRNGISGWEDVDAGSANARLYFERYARDDLGNYPVIKSFEEDPYGMIKPASYWGEDSHHYSVYAHESLDTDPPDRFVIVTLAKSQRKILIENGGWMFTDANDRIVLVSDAWNDNEVYDAEGEENV